MAKRNRIVGLITAGIIGILIAGGLFLRSREEAQRSASNARKAPAFSLQDSSGKVHSLRDLEGKPVLVHFWASWCPPCLEEIPNWMALAKRYEGKALGFVAISLDPQWGDALKVLPSDKTPANVVSLLDPSGKLSELYGTFQFPETYLLNAHHEIVHKFVGGQDWTNPQITQTLDKLIASQ